jgi:hypothetical protein
LERFDGFFVVVFLEIYIMYKIVRSYFYNSYIYPTFY